MNTSPGRLSTRHSTALALTPADLSRWEEGNDEEEKEAAAAAAAAAQAAREALERMWSSPPADSDNDNEDDHEEKLTATLPELTGEGADGEGAQVGVLRTLRTW